MFGATDGATHGATWDRPLQKFINSGSVGDRQSSRQVLVVVSSVILAGCMCKSVRMD